MIDEIERAKGQFRHVPSCEYKLVKASSTKRTKKACKVSIKPQSDVFRTKSYTIQAPKLSLPPKSLGNLSEGLKASNFYQHKPEVSSPAPEQQEESFRVPNDELEVLTLMEQFDDLKRKDKTKEIPEKSAEGTSEIGHAQKFVIPKLAYSLTKTDEYKKRSTLDRVLVERKKWLGKKPAQDFSEIGKRILKELESELKEVHDGDEFKRLQINSYFLEKITQLLPTEGNLLKSIKDEYDKTFAAFNESKNEIESLNMRLQKMLALNENRVLLKIEKKKREEMELKVKELTEENEQLRAELQEKLTVYSKYAPKKESRNTLHPLAERPRRLNFSKEAVNECSVEDKFVEALEKTNKALKDAEAGNIQMSVYEAERREEIDILKRSLAKKEEAYNYLLSEYQDVSDEYNQQQNSIEDLKQANP